MVHSHAWSTIVTKLCNNEQRKDGTCYAIERIVAVATCTGCGVIRVLRMTDSLTEVVDIKADGTQIEPCPPSSEGKVESLKEDIASNCFTAGVGAGGGESNPGTEAIFIDTLGELLDKHFGKPDSEE